MDVTTIDWHGHRFELLAGRAIHWPAARSLIVADVHFGKADHFRQAGVPVPWGTADASLARLDALLDRTAAARLLVLGDLFHARTGLSAPLLDRLGSWRDARRALEIVVVPGNHDAGLHDDEALAGLGLDWIETDHREAGLRFRHAPPTDEPDAATLAGHVHPAVRLHGVGRASMRLPCFSFAARVALLPAFGAFTGMHPIRPRRGDRVFAIHPDASELIEVTGPTRV